MGTHHSARRLLLAATVVAATLVLLGVATAPAVAEGPNGTAAATGDEFSQQESEGFTLIQDVVFNDDGSIQAFQISLDVDNESYQQFEDAADSEGYDSGAEWLANFYLEQNDEMTAIRDYGTQSTAKGTAMTLVYDADVTAAENTTVAIENGELVVETVNVQDPTEDSSVEEVVYRYHMPGEVTDSNADAVSGSTAVWALHENPQSRLVVASTTDATSAVNERDDDNQQTSDGLDWTQDIFFADDGSIGAYQLTLDVDDESYRQFETAADERGYESGAEWFANAYLEQNDEVTAIIEYRSEDSAKGTRMTVVYEADLSAAENTSVTVENGRLTVETINVETANEDPALGRVVSRYHMPGRIIDSNADTVSGSVAVWALHRNPPPTMRVTSATDATSGPDDPQNDDQQQSGFDLQFNLTVGSDGTVDSGSVSLDVTDETYQQFQTTAEEQGYDSGAEVLANQLVETEEGYTEYGNARDIDSAKGTRMVFDVAVNASAAENLTVTREGDEVTFRVTNIEVPSEDPTLGTSTYRITMPGEITETNAIETRGNTAIFRLHEDAVSELEVRSGVEQSADDDDEDDEDDTAEESSGAFGPGFGVVVALVATLVAALVLARRS